ncbi:MAG: T9SS type A sorting domain-containing protein [Saprospiraceae bacterium]|nr:T9SS type A sorting domain-containing protein [Saprospiraceae bacterium]
MKTRILKIFVVIFFGLHANAQLILNQSNTAFNPGPIKAIAGDTSGFKMPLPGNNQVWDYSGIGNSGASSWGYITPDSPDFESATFADTNLSSVLIPGSYYHYDTYYETDETGANSLGYEVFLQRYGIGSLTGNVLDSCNFPKQVWKYSSPSYLLKFPSTMSTSFHSNTRSAVNFLLSIKAYSLKNVPCQKVTNNVRHDTIVGWGKMQVPTINGPSLSYDVLMLKRTVISKDSFYMNGIPAPAALLNAFGLSQGQTTITNRYIFWRENARYSLMLINFGSNNFTKPSSIYYDGEAKSNPNQINQNLNNIISISPNPNQGEFYINSELSDNTEYDIVVFNMMGQIVYSEKSVIAGNDQIRINDRNIKKGTYFIRVKNKNRTEISKFIVN